MISRSIAGPLSPSVFQIREFLRGLHGVVAEDKAGWDAMAGVDDLLTKGIYNRIE
jgi:hypothetical protein